MDFGTILLTIGLILFVCGVCLSGLGDNMLIIGAGTSIGGFIVAFLGVCLSWYMEYTEHLKKNGK